MEKGTKKDGGKLRLSLIPFSSLEPVAKVLEFGAEKYSVDNWQHVPNGPERYTDAALRHLHAHADGEWLDPESGLPHVAHAVCCLLFVLWFRRDVPADTFEVEDNSCNINFSGNHVFTMAGECVSCGHYDIKKDFVNRQHQD